jgi:hypothetical protein
MIRPKIMVDFVADENLCLVNSTLYEGSTRLMKLCVPLFTSPEYYRKASYGFRPGRSAHQAVAQAQVYLEQGYSYIVDIDPEKFFDRVCHDRLLSRLAQRITDKRVLKLIRAFLQAGILEDGLMTIPTEGTLQDSPLAPFLSNVVWTSWTRNSRTAGTGSVGIRMIAISTCGVPEPGRVCWRASVAFSHGA